MERKIIFKYNNRGYDNELILPVTPASFEVTSGIRTETVNLHEVGDHNIPGYTTLDTLTIACMLPAQKYGFVTGPFNPDPYVFTSAFEAWSKEHLPVRFVVSGTPINKAVYVESIEYGEQDGTNDVYATVTLKERRELAVAQVNNKASAQNLARPASDPPVTSQTYVVVKGDTLWGICRRFYNDANLCQKLAAHNGIKNANIIQIGQKLKIPDKAKLG